LLDGTEERDTKPMKIHRGWLLLLLLLY
jgi:hypothetical protein